MWSVAATIGTERIDPYDAARSVTSRRLVRSHVHTLTFRDTFWPELHHPLLVGGAESQIPFQHLRAEEAQEAQAAAAAGVGVAEGLQLGAAAATTVYHDIRRARMEGWRLANSTNVEVRPADVKFSV